jgi:hypothetical protein
VFSIFECFDLTWGGEKAGHLTFSSLHQSEVGVICALRFR